MGRIWGAVGRLSYDDVTAKRVARRGRSEKAVEARRAGFCAHPCCQFLDMASATEPGLDLDPLVSCENGSGEAVTVGESNVDLSCGMNNPGRTIDEGAAEALPLPTHRFQRAIGISVLQKNLWANSGSGSLPSVW